MKEKINNIVKFETHKNIGSYVELGQLAFAIHDCVVSAFGRKDFDINDTLEHLWR